MLYLHWQTRKEDLSRSGKALFWILDGDIPKDRKELATFFEEKLSALTELIRDFRRDDFYERFAAKSQVERVETIRRRMERQPGMGGKIKEVNEWLMA